MRILKTSSACIGVLFGLMLIVASPTSSFGQGRGNGNGRGPNMDKKCAKFVNCHDARDGRWDGRGPATQVVNQPTDIDIFRNRRNRDRDRDDEINRRRRDRGIDRDGDGDVDRDDAIIGRRERQRRTNRDDIDRDGSWRHRRERRARNDGSETRVRRHGRADLD
jgi:hypothetical protein